jgi:hypothetical protein
MTPQANHPLSLNIASPQLRGYIQAPAVAAGQPTPRPTAMWHSLFIPIFLALGGLALIISGINIWIRKTAKFADPFLWGPLTGGLGCVVVRSIFGDAEIRGFAARVLALFQLLLGISFIVILLSGSALGARFSKRAHVAEAAAAEPPFEMTYLTPEEAPPLAEAPSPPAATLPTTPVAASESAPASTTASVQATPPATPPVAAVASASARQPSPSPSPPATTEQGSPGGGTIHRMPKNWMPEGMQRR